VPNEAREELYVVLGCFGLKTDGFVSCAGVENRILQVGEHIGNFNGMMEYFESCRLFDKSMYEFNAIRHFVHNLQDRFDQVAVGRPLWSEKQFRLYQEFVIQHRLCGLYIRLHLDIPASEEPLEDKSAFVKSQNKRPVSPPQVNLSLIRGRR